MKNNIWLLSAASLLLLAGGCKKDNDAPNPTIPVELSLQAPTGIANFKFTELTIQIKEVNSGQQWTEKLTGLQRTLQLPTGLYDIQVNGKASYELDGRTMDTNVAASVLGKQLSSTNASLSFPLFIINGNGNFVLEEIYFSGSAAPGNALYLGDRYIKIYNNSDQVLYADGLVIASSAFNTSLKNNYTPNIMSEAVTVDAIITIPGAGKDHPVQPGGSILIAETAINHKQYNPNAFDLNKADFEIVDADDEEDVDNPAVPNMENFVEKLSINNSGYQAFILARIPTTKVAYLKDQVYDFSYPFVMGDMSFDMEESAYKIPNEWIIDAVNLSVKSEFKWIVTDPSVDRGWTYTGSFEGDASRFGKSVKRKVLSTSALGHPLLKDTNDSSSDFEAAAVPSLKK